MKVIPFRLRVQKLRIHFLLIVIFVDVASLQFSDCFRCSRESRTFAADRRSLLSSLASVRHQDIYIIARFYRFVFGIICACDRGILPQRHSLHRSTPDTCSFSIFVSVAKRYIQFRISLFWCSILIQPSYVTATFDVRCRDLIVLCCTRCIFRKSHFDLKS